MNWTAYGLNSLLWCWHEAQDTGAGQGNLPGKLWDAFLCDTSTWPLSFSRAPATTTIMATLCCAAQRSSRSFSAWHGNSLSSDTDQQMQLHPVQGSEITCISDKSQPSLMHLGPCYCSALMCEKGEED